MKKTNTTAIILAAGQGKRMNSNIQKQYLLINEKPVLYYSLKVFEDSFIDDVVLVVGKDEIEYCKNEIVEKYGFKKVKTIVAGGKERYHSVANGLQAINWECDYVFVHDGARPFIDDEILARAYEKVKASQAAVVGMPVKDTIKISDENGYVSQTPNRAYVWQIQTPQVFNMEIISTAYKQLLENEKIMLEQGISITDDAMVVEHFTNLKVKLVEGSYKNIKITTPEDLEIAKIFLNKK